MNSPLKTPQAGQEQLVETAISDLFFNMDHSQYHQMKFDKAAEPSDLQEVIENDAKQMACWLAALGHEVDPEQLVIDFFDRL